MAPSIFRYFSALPCELRLQIWELPIRPSGYTGGLHHFALSSTDAKDPKTDRESLTFLEPHQVQLNGRLELLGVPKIGRPEGDSSRNPAKQSVYFWDAGLWTACMESREVMVKRTKRIRHVEERGMLGPVSHVPEVVTVPEHGQPRQLMVVPRTDLFCFTPEAWGLRIDWQCIWFSLFSSRLPGQSVRHLAFEFNPSWNLDWPAHFSQLYHERSGCCSHSTKAGKHGDEIFRLADRSKYSAPPNSVIIGRDAAGILRPQHGIRRG